jgi:hypothetical protein
MTIEIITLAGVIVNVAILIVYLLTLRALIKQAKTTETMAAQAVNTSFLQLFNIIEKHHSPQVAEYRRFARHELPKKCNDARVAGKSLKEHDPNASKIASDVANYYESIGMLVEHGENNLLQDVESALIDMVHVSAHDIWEIYYENMDVIHPGKIGSWAGSFEHLYFRIAELKKPSCPATKPRLKRD